MKYLRIFNDHTDYGDRREELIYPNVSYCLQEEELHYAGDYERYLTFECVDNQWSELDFDLPEWLPISMVEYVEVSVDGGRTWDLYENDGESGISIYIDDAPLDNKVMFRGSATQYAGQVYIDEEKSTTLVYSYFSGNGGNFKVYGNIMSLFYADNFIDRSFSNGTNYNCYSLFYNFTGLIDASNLILPVTTLLEEHCYDSMFNGCTSLTTAPVLPATTLAYRCYRYMFKGCSSLMVAPELPVTTLANSCYQSMFQGCTSLTAAPVLLATTLVPYCYEAMFASCANLRYVKAMFTTAPVTVAPPGYTMSWLNNVAATGTFVKNVNANWSMPGIDGIPIGWTVQTVSA